MKAVNHRDEFGEIEEEELERRSRLAQSILENGIDSTDLPRAEAQDLDEMVQAYQADRF